MRIRGQKKRRNIIDVPVPRRTSLMQYFIFGPRVLSCSLPLIHLLSLIIIFVRIRCGNAVHMVPGRRRNGKEIDFAHNVYEPWCASLSLPLHSWFPFDNEYRTLCDCGGVGGGGLRGSAHTTLYTRVFSGDGEGDDLGRCGINFAILSVHCILRLGFWSL